MLWGEGRRTARISGASYSEDVNAVPQLSCLLCAVKMRQLLLHQLLGRETCEFAPAGMPLKDTPIRGGALCLHEHSTVERLNGLKTRSMPICVVGPRASIGMRIRFSVNVAREPSSKSILSLERHVFTGR